jgi:hypothetical protein
MTKPTPDVFALPLLERATLALEAAVEKVIEEHAREGRPLYIWRDGEVLAVPAEEFLPHPGPRVARDDDR